MGEYVPHARQAYNELDNAVRLGAEDGITAARKRLDAAGLDGAAIVDKARAKHAAESDPQTKRAAAETRRAAMRAEVEEEAARQTPPRERATKAEAKRATTDGSSR